MKKKEITEETRNKLLDSVESSIEHITQSVDETRKNIKKIPAFKNLITKIDSEGNEIEKIERLEKLLDYNILIGIIFLDLASLTRAHLNSKYSYEKLYSARQIIVVINEGYKQIYNFITSNKNGDLLTKNRNKSFWFKDIKNIVDNLTSPELKTEYNLLTKKLDDYFEENFSAIKTQRDLSVHYDKKATKVYDMMLSLDIEETFKKMVPFLKILIEMFHYTEKIALVSSVNEKNNNNNLKDRIKMTMQQIENKIETLESNEKTENLKTMLAKLKSDFKF